MLAGPLGTPKDGDTSASWGEWSLEEFLSFDFSPPHHSLLESRFPAEALSFTLQCPKQLEPMRPHSRVCVCVGGEQMYPHVTLVLAPVPDPSPPAQPSQPSLQPAASPSCLAFVHATSRWNDLTCLPTTACLHVQIPFPPLHTTASMKPPQLEVIYLSSWPSQHLSS